MGIMFGRKKPQADTETGEKTKASDRTTSYRLDNDAAPASSNVSKTTSYVSAVQRNGRGYETLN
jgi:hypothetical protein